MAWFKRFRFRRNVVSSENSETHPGSKDAGPSPQPEAEGLAFDSDRPIQREDQDFLGFDHVAQKLSKAILAGSAAEGLVIGIEGEWGSGKSSILNLVCKHVTATSGVTLIKFAPWIVGNRDQLVGALIAEVATAIAKLSNEASDQGVKQRAADLARKFRKYGATLSKRITPLLDLASPWIPHGEIVKKANKALKSYLTQDERTPPLAEQKEDLIQGLKTLNHRFIITIDDIDRLEPTEVAEVVRLIRAVGDFPNIIYLVCYDKTILAQSLQSALKIENGKSYLQKIVQVSFSVPSPEEFDLRRWLGNECTKLHLTVTGRNIPEEVRDRLMIACDTFGGAIKTPREVRLIQNSLRLFYPPVATDIDFADMCFLQIVRILNEDLYKWIERYLVVFAAAQHGARITAGEQRKLANN